jgi:chromosome segregation ATPase
MERLEALGKVQQRNLGSEDVSSQFIDLKARLSSALREEQSLLSLLGKAGTVTEILTIERELSRVRSEIERVQGQLNFLERRVELATISVSLFPPQEEVVQPPSANLGVEVSDVASGVAEVRSLVATLEGRVDRVSLTLAAYNGRETANVSLRVFSDKFDQAITSLEGLGEVKGKVLEQGYSPMGTDKARPEQPNAVIYLALTEPGDSKTWLWWAIGGPVGGVALLAVVVFLVYRAGRSRGV